ncbi:Tryptophan synthase beta chain [Spirochaeta thermophila DSM 6578]|uniref:Tryptophan synthase beta chain n=1 Tax=Winmispira thermophila (strain ATCC 700085 / DSM 6578 / Z-1203) TaxID=869211 RepID=G0GDP9_WINT7|nr:TrpB-like pyridoxal phosphate-dependent enzyme [Spirochaeta thermophila]AEJ62179.1 Tryptophan synthase beta chain [Spirochaeta thermophila DSM 6578]
MQRKILLSEKDLPSHWYNILADLPGGPLDPPLHPVTKQPLSPDELSALFPRALIEQEMSGERWIEIPEEVRKILALWRPTPLYRAYQLEQALETPARIYFKWEGASPPGSHKPNTSVAQAYYNRKEGITRLTTETGAGQWGSSLAFAGRLFGMEVRVYMVKVSYEGKPYRRIMMETWGAECIPSPSPRTKVGKAILEKDPDSPGSLGIAISEAVEEAVEREDTHYALGSVLNHVLLHQTVIGLECRKQLELASDYPDVVIGCVGGGSNFGGIALPFAYDKIHGKDVRLVAVEPSACPTLTKGVYTYDYGDTGKMTPIVRMHTLGHDFVPPGIHAGGLRYHGMAPIVSRLVKEGVVEARAYHQRAVFEAAVLFARTEGFIVAPETAHAIKACVDEALAAKEEGKERVILVNASGHGHFDMAAYQQYFEGRLEDYEYPEEKIREALSALPQV